MNKQRNSSGRDWLLIVLLLAVGWFLWQSGALDSLAAGGQTHITANDPTPPAAQGEQPIIIIMPELATAVPELATAVPEPTAVPVRIQSNEVESHGHSSTAGGCTTTNTALGQITSCVSKEGE